MKEKLLNFLKKTQEIIESDGETEFVEIRRRKKKEITDLFQETFAGSITYDGDSDGSIVNAEITIDNFKYSIGFYSKVCDGSEIYEYVNDMTIYCYSKNPEDDIEIEDIFELIEWLDTEAKRNELLKIINLYKKAGEAFNEHCGEHNCNKCGFNDFSKNSKIPCDVLNSIGQYLENYFKNEGVI